MNNPIQTKDNSAESVKADSPPTIETSDRLTRNWHNLDNRLSMIAEAAYFKAEKRRFEPGSAEADWLEAEQELAEIMGET